MFDDFGDRVVFEGNIQGIFQYINVAGEKKVFVVANGIIHLREYDKVFGGIIWKVINPNTPLVNTTKRIKIMSYYDRVYFNDDDQIKFFDTNYNRGIENMYIMFAGAKFYIYNTSLSNAEEHDIAVGGGTSESVLGKKLYDDIIANVGAITIDINWTATDSDGNYYLLNNGNTTDTTYHIFKVDKDLEFIDFISGVKVSDLRIMQFGIVEDKLYIWDTYDRITIINTVSLSEISTSPEVKSWLDFPEISTVKYSYLYADEDYLYLYTNKRDSTRSMGALGTGVRSNLQSTYLDKTNSAVITDADSELMMNAKIGVWGNDPAFTKEFTLNPWYYTVADTAPATGYDLVNLKQFNSRVSNILFLQGTCKMVSVLGYTVYIKQHPFWIGAYEENYSQFSDVGFYKKMRPLDTFKVSSSSDEFFGLQIFHRDTFINYSFRGYDFNPVLGKTTETDSFKTFFKFGDRIHFGFEYSGENFYYNLNVETQEYSFSDNKDVYDNFVPIGTDYILGKNAGAYADIWKNIDALAILNDVDTIDYAASATSPFLDYKKNYDLFTLQKLDSAHILDYEMSVAASTIKKGFYRYAMELVFVNGEKTKLSEWTIPIEVIADDTYVITIKEITTGLYFDKGTGTYNVNSIVIYRSYNEDINDVTKKWEAPFAVDTKAFADVDVVTTYADNKQDSDYAPFNYYSEYKVTRDMRFEDIVMHKEQLCLIGKKNELNDGTKNSSIDMYSAIGFPEVIEPTAFRPIESGDSDRLVAGISVDDYLYHFKEGKIYGVLSYLPDGQIVTISTEYGTSYKFLITDLDGKVYFLNQYGIFFIQGASPPKKISDPNVDDFFNKQSDLFINFEDIDTAFATKDNIKDEIRFFVPVGKNSIQYVISYSSRDRAWKTYKYYNDIADQSNIFEIATDRYLTLIAGTDGVIYETEEVNNDNGHKIRARLKTKAFNNGSVSFEDIWKLIRVTGKYFTNMNINYIIDGDYRWGSVSQRVNNKIHTAETEVFDGNCKEIEVDIITESANREPIEIDEVLLGYDKSKRIF
jgi:hypothetical protein